MRLSRSCLRLPPGPAWEGAIYAAYFLGAFISTLPGGILSDRYGRMPVIRTGLALTVVSGILLYYTNGPLPVITLRVLEGLGAGLFIAAGMSYVNSQPNHTRMSGYYLAMLNFGLVLGLAASGWLAVRFVQPALGIGVFTGPSLAALVADIVFHETPEPPPPVRVQKPKKLQGGMAGRSSGMLPHLLYPMAGYGILRSSLSASPALSPRSTRHFPVNQQMCSVSGLRE